MRFLQWRTGEKLPVLGAGTWNMGENAARADWAGVGIRLPRRLLSPATLRLAVERALGDPRRRERAAAMAGWVAAHDGAAAAVAELEALAP